jgi:hypothetical protein
MARLSSLGLSLALPGLVNAQASPFMTGATALQTNILAWLTPIAVILVIAQVASTYGAGAAHTIVENCSSTLILRCSASEGGGTSRFASTLIGQREVLRTTQSRSCRADELLGSVTRSEHVSMEPAVMDSEIEQLPDLAGYLKFASRGSWRRVTLRRQQTVDSGSNPTPAFVPAPAPQMAAVVRVSASASSPVAVAPATPLPPAPARSPRKRAASPRKRAAKAASAGDLSTEPSP